MVEFVSSINLCIYLLHTTHSQGGLQRVSVYLIEEVYLKTYTLERADYTFATSIPNTVPRVLQKGPVEWVIYLQIFRDVKFFVGERGFHKHPGLCRPL